MPAQVLEGARRGLPTLVLLRPAPDADPDLRLVGNPDLGPGRGDARIPALLPSRSCPRRGGFVTATFDDVVGLVRARESSASTSGARTALATVRAHAWRTWRASRARSSATTAAREGSGTTVEAVHPPPLSGARRRSEAEVAERVRREVSPRALADAHAVYRALVPDA